MTHIEAAPGHDTGMITTTPEVAHFHIQRLQSLIPLQHTTSTPTTDHPCTEVPHPTTPEVKVDPTHIHPTKPSEEICTFQQITQQTTPQEEPQNENRRSTHRLLQF